MIQPPERLEDRDKAIEAMLPHVPFDGWTLRALRAGLRDAGMPADEADLLFPLGTVDMIETFCDLADRRMEEAAKDLPPDMRLPDRVRAVIALRLEQSRPHKEAVRRAIAVLALPQNARAAASCTARTVDSIWHAAGDRSADFAWYTKRAQLAAIYTATVLYWLRDTSEGDADTLAFLDRRLAGSARLRKLRNRFDDMVAKLPRPKMLRAQES
ncbi:MAG: COQ9 family protein [Proteobacteria bacterium]|nr:COQ9 family protein [Pseudomonadota bacterium]